MKIEKDTNINSAYGGGATGSDVGNSAANVRITTSTCSDTANEIFKKTLSSYKKPIATIKKRDLSQHTIDKKHSEMLVHFEKNEKEAIPQLKLQIQKLKNEMKKTPSKNIEILEKIENLRKIGRAHV